MEKKIVLFSQKGAWSGKAILYIACARFSVSVDERKKRTIREAKETQRKSGHLCGLHSIFTILRKASIYQRIQSGDQV